MTDLYMVLLLVGTYVVFWGFLTWCDRVTGESGGDGR